MKKAHVISFRRAEPVNEKVPLLDVLVNDQSYKIHRAMPIEFAKERAREIKASFEKQGEKARIEA